VGHFSSKVGPTHNKQVSFAAALSIKVSLNTSKRQCVPYVLYVITPCSHVMAVEMILVFNAVLQQRLWYLFDAPAK